MMLFLFWPKVQLLRKPVWIQAHLQTSFTLA